MFSVIKAEICKERDIMNLYLNLNAVDTGNFDYPNFLHKMTKLEFDKYIASGYIIKNTIDLKHLLGYNCSSELSCKEQFHENHIYTYQSAPPLSRRYWIINLIFNGNMMKFNIADFYVKDKKTKYDKNPMNLLQQISNDLSKYIQERNMKTSKSVDLKENELLIKKIKQLEEENHELKSNKVKEIPFPTLITPTINTDDKIVVDVVETPPVSLEKNQKKSIKTPTKTPMTIKTPKIKKVKKPKKVYPYIPESELIKEMKKLAKQVKTPTEGEVTVEASPSKEPNVEEVKELYSTYDASKFPSDTAKIVEFV